MFKQEMPKLGRRATIICRLLLHRHGPINIYSNSPGAKAFFQTSVTTEMAGKMTSLSWRPGRPTSNDFDVLMTWNSKGVVAGGDRDEARSAES